MAMEALDTIALAEERSRQILASAGTEAKKALQEAEDAVSTMIAEAEGKAEEELKTLFRKADEKAKADAEKLAAATREREADIRARAEGRRDTVVNAIMERIVNG